MKIPNGSSKIDSEFVLKRPNRFKEIFCFKFLKVLKMSKKNFFDNFLKFCNSLLFENFIKILNFLKSIFICLKYDKSFRAVLSAV